MSVSNSLLVLFIILLIQQISDAVNISYASNDKRLPFRWNSFCAGVYNDELTLYGGWSYNIPNNILEAYTSNLYGSAYNWTQYVPPYLPFNYTAMNNVQPCVQYPNDSLLYSVPNKIRREGFNDFFGDRLLIFNLNTKQFHDTTLYNSVIPYRSMHSCIVMVNWNEIYIIGGEDNSSSTERVQVYHRFTDTWSIKAPLNQNRYMFGCDKISDNGSIYIFSGVHHNGTTNILLNTIEKYNVATNIWTEINAKVIIPRWQHKCNYFMNRIFCVGGRESDSISETVRLIEVFNPFNEKILTLEYNLHLNIGRYYSQSIIYNNTLLILGGRNIQTRWDTIAIIDQNNIIQTSNPTAEPTIIPTILPTNQPTIQPTILPTYYPTYYPTVIPTNNPSLYPTFNPTYNPIFSVNPSELPTYIPTNAPSLYNEGGISKTSMYIYVSSKNNNKDEELSSNDKTKEYFVMSLIAIIIALILCLICLIFLIIHKRKKNKQQQFIEDNEVGIELHQVTTDNNNRNNNVNMNSEPDVYSDNNALSMW
eukprot:364604_1